MGFHGDVISQLQMFSSHMSGRQQYLCPDFSDRSAASSWDILNWYYSAFGLPSSETPSVCFFMVIKGKNLNQPGV